MFLGFVLLRLYLCIISSQHFDANKNPLIMKQ